MRRLPIDPEGLELLLHRLAESSRADREALQGSLIGERDCRNDPEFELRRPGELNRRTH